jgi:hypothetical protein
LFTALPSSRIVLHAWADRDARAASIFNGLHPATANTCNVDATFIISSLRLRRKQDTRTETVSLLSSLLGLVLSPRELLTAHWQQGKRPRKQTEVSPWSGAL